jgi:perosamine synthetase
MSPHEVIPLARPDLGPSEEEAVLEVLRSGRLSLGPMQDRFERDFARWLGAEDAVAVSSGTSALHLGVRALGWGEGDEVITSPLSFVASANCLLYEGATPVFCDVDPTTLNLDPAGVRGAIGARTAGLLPVHIFAYPAAMPELEASAEEASLGVLEDACQALGAIASDGVRVGARGNAATFAFYANKQLTTGEGGMLVPPSPEVAQRARSERNQGRAPDMGKVEHDRLGFNYRLTELAAALGIAQLERVDRMLAERVLAAELYRERLADLGGAPAGDGDPAALVLPCEDRGDERRSWFVYVVQLPEGVDREAVIAALDRAGVQSKAYLPCIHLLPFYRERFGFREGQFPVAERAAERSLALPFFTSIGEAEVDRVGGALARALAERVAA